MAQVAAHTLDIPIEKVIIKASDTTVGANSIVTGGSFGTDICCHVSYRVWFLFPCIFLNFLSFPLVFLQFSFPFSCFSLEIKNSVTEKYMSLYFLMILFFFFNSLFLEIEPKWFSCLLIKNEWECFSFLSQGTKVACEAIRKRIDAIKSEELKKDSEKEMSWEQLVKICHLRDVDLCERYWYDGVVLYYRVLYCFALFYGFELDMMLRFQVSYSRTVRYAQGKFM